MGVCVCVSVLDALMGAKVSRHDGAVLFCLLLLVLLLLVGRCSLIVVENGSLFRANCRSGGVFVNFSD